jgi:hypothetical protein
MPKKFLNGITVAGDVTLQNIIDAPSTSKLLVSDITGKLFNKELSTTSISEGVNLFYTQTRVVDTIINAINNFIFTIITESTTITFSSLINKKIILVFLGDKLLTPTVGTPTANEYKYNITTGIFEFGTDLQIGSVLQIVNISTNLSI